MYKVPLGPDPLFNTEQLHSKANLFTLDKRRLTHLLHYAYDLIATGCYIDNRDIATRYRRGKRITQTKPNSLFRYTGGGGSSFGPNVKSQHRGPKRGPETLPPPLHLICVCVGVGVGRCVCACACV